MGFSVEEKGQQALDEVRRKVGDKLKKWDAIKISTYVSAPTKPDTPKEGDVWEERGRRWTIKNGIKQTVTKFDAARVPQWCPQCGKVMNTPLDDNCYYTEGECHVCVIKKETRMRIDGTYDDYIRRKFQRAQAAYVRDKLEWLKSVKNELKKPQFHFIDGRYEEWNMDLSQVKKDLDHDIEGLTKLLEELEENLDEKITTKTNHSGRNSG